MKIITKNLEIKYQVFQEFVQKFSFMGKENILENLDFLKN